jgi:hypothetical protein
MRAKARILSLSGVLTSLAGGGGGGVSVTLTTLNTQITAGGPRQYLDDKFDVSIVIDVRTLQVPLVSYYAFNWSIYLGMMRRS